ncbi:hypothetical protein FDECE_16038 [Fusarium decemcellulare]|nr:hypothetical protein FDECE_16038 [Fusarium decemcellulare]
MDYDEKEHHPRKRIKIPVSTPSFSVYRFRPQGSRDSPGKIKRRPGNEIGQGNQPLADQHTTSLDTLPSAGSDNDESDEDDNSEVLSDGDGEPEEHVEEEMSSSSDEDAEDGDFVVGSESENPDEAYEPDAIETMPSSSDLSIGPRSY